MRCSGANMDSTEVYLRPVWSQLEALSMFKPRRSLTSKNKRMGLERKYALLGGCGTSMTFHNVVTFDIKQEYPEVAYGRQI